jgi:hypothetical protein
MKNRVSGSNFRMDRSRITMFNSLNEANAENCFWLNETVEERISAIEFLRAQWIEMNNLPIVMDRMFFEYR